MKDYCKKCNVRIKIGGMMASFMSDDRDKPVEFKDGYWCASCARRRK